MSLNDITLSGEVFGFSSINGKSVVRSAEFSTLTPPVIKKTIEIAHTDGSGNKPDRHLIKMTATVRDDLNVDRTYQLHTVVTVPKGGSEPAGAVVAGILGNYMNTLLATDTGDFLENVVNGAYS